jgi:hypothetical protein
LGWVGCDDAKSSTLGVDNCGGTGVESEKTGVGEEVDVPTPPLAELARDVTGNFQVGDRVLIKAGGCFDGKSATIFDCVSNSREIGVKLDQSEGGYILWFEAKYLVQVGVKM